MGVAIRRLARPAVAAALLQTLFNITDTFWVGRGLGPAALAGVSTGGFAVWMVLSLAELTAAGLTAVASRRHGEGRPRAAAATVYQATLMALALSLVVGLGGLAGLHGLFALMETPAPVTTQGAGYLSTYLSGVPIVFAYFVMDAAFRAAGDTRTPFYLLGGAVALNLLLDPVLILGLGPAPRLGIAGAAGATLLTRAGAGAIGYGLLLRRGLVVRERLDLRAWRPMAAIGLPTAAGGAVFAFVYILLTRITSRFGTAALAALGVGHRIESLSYMACVGFGFAAATAVGQNLGAGAPERARASGVSAARHALVATAAAAVAFVLVPRTLVGLFTHDPAVIDAGASYLRIVAVAQLFMSLDLVLESAMAGAGYTLLPMAASLTLTVARLPLAAWLAGPLGLAGIWWTISLTAAARGVSVASIWRLGGWRRRVV